MRAFLSALTLTLISLTFSVPVFAQKDDDVIRVDSTIVLVNASVLDATGKTVSGLMQKHFTALEDGVVQPIISFAAESTPFASVILIDTSGSMEQRVSMARSAAINFLAGLRADDNVAIYSFDSKVKQVQDFSNSRDITEAIYDLKADGMTALNDAIYKAAVLLSGRSEKRRAIVVLSDGADTQSMRSPNGALNAAIAANATIYTIDMSSPEDRSPGKAQGQAALKNFAQRSGGTFVAAPGGTAMRNAFREIVEELGNQYTITYEPTNTKADGKFRSIEIRVAKPGLTIRTRKGYNAPKSK